MPKPKEVRFLSAAPSNGDLTRFGLFRLVDGVITHIMDARGMWVAMPADDDAAVELVHNMIVDGRLPMWKEETRDESFEETNDAPELADESADVSVGVVADWAPPTV